MNIKRIAIKISTLFTGIFIIQNLSFEIWYRLGHNLPIFKQLSSLPAYSPPIPTVFTPLFWIDYSPRNYFMAILGNIIVAVILTGIVVGVTYTIKKYILKK